MTEQIVRIGLIGTGLIAQVMHLPHLKSMPDRFDVVAASDVSAGTLAAVAERYEIPQTYTDYNEMLEKADLDAVLVLTGNQAPPAIAAARAGKHIFVEKPMCNNLDEADEMIDTVSQSGVVGMVGFHKRYDPGYRYGQSLIHSIESPQLVRLHDVIGPNEAFLGHYDILRVDDVDADAKQKMQAAQYASMAVAIGEQPVDIFMAYNLLLGLSTHDMTILHGAVGAPERVIGADIWKNGLAISAIFGYPGELRCVFDTAITPGLARFDETLSVYGLDRAVTVRFPSPFIKNAPTKVEDWRMEDDKLQEVETLSSYEEAFKLELIHYHECITQGKTPETPLTEGREDIAVLIDIVKKAVEK